MDKETAISILNINVSDFDWYLYLIKKGKGEKEYSTTEFGMPKGECEILVKQKLANAIEVIIKNDIAAYTPLNTKKHS